MHMLVKTHVHGLSWFVPMYKPCHCACMHAHILHCGQREAHGQLGIQDQPLLAILTRAMRLIQHAEV